MDAKMFPGLLSHLRRRKEQQEENELLVFP
jgi:hypothetical protein